MAVSNRHQFLSDLDKKLWTAADRLRSNLDAAVYKHAVLGLVFLKYVSDAFELRQQDVETQLRDKDHDYFLDPAAIRKNMKALCFELPKAGAKLSAGRINTEVQRARSFASSLFSAISVFQTRSWKKHG